MMQSNYGMKRLKMFVVTLVLLSLPASLRAESDPKPMLRLTGPASSIVPLPDAVPVTAPPATPVVEPAPAQDAATGPTKPRKLVIFYSTIGQGHESAAKAIKAQVEAREPGTEVVLKNSRDFITPKWWAKWDERIYWFIVKKTNKFEGFYQSHMKSGQAASSLQDLGTDLDHPAVAAWLKEQAPDAVIATHANSAQMLSNLRQDRLLTAPLGWLNTDYIKGYFPRISKAVDMSFLPHPELMSIYEAAGVDPKKFASTGMPISKVWTDPPKPRAEVLGGIGLDPNVRTITLSSGAEGVGDFADVVKQIASQTKDPVQIIAVAGKSKANFDNLNKLLKTLPPHVTLKVYGWSTELPTFVKASDLYITKAGGLSPTEAFAANVPTVVMEVYHGHEGENATLFERLGLATISRDPKTVGKEVLRLLGDPATQQKQLIAQAAFRKSMDLTPVVDFALKSSTSVPAADLVPGHETGAEYSNVANTFRKLDLDLPAEAEILLSYPKAGWPKAGEPVTDGHVAIRIGQDVLVFNPDTKEMEKTSLTEYMYGTKNKSGKTGKAGVTYGVAYERDTLGVRFSGLDASRLNDMSQEGLRALVGNYEHSDRGATELIAHILSRANLGEIPKPKKGAITPLDVVNHYIGKLQANPNIKSVLVNYAHTPGVGKQPTNRQAYILGMLGFTPKGGRDLLTRASKRVTSYVGDNSLHYEDMDGVSQARIESNTATLATRTSEGREPFRQQEEKVHEMFKGLKAKGYTAPEVSRRVKDFMSALSETEQVAVREGHFDTLTGEVAEKAKALRDFVTAANTGMKEFHAAYDDFNSKKLEHMVEVNHLRLDSLMAELALRLTPKDMAAIRKKFALAEKEYDIYMKSRVLYNQPKDVKRISGVRAYMQHSKELIQQADRAVRLASGEKLPTTPILERLGGLLKTVDLVTGALQMIGTAAIKHGELPNGQTPLSEGSFNFMGRYGRIEGMKVKVEGRENLPAPGAGKVVNLYAVQHANPLLDNMAMAKLGLKNFGIFGAVDDFGQPKFFADWLDQSDHFIAVGRGSDKPIEKAVAMLKRGKTNDFVIYPEGSVSAGLYETRQPRAKMVDGLIKRLQAEGYEVNIVPISLPDNYRYNSVWNSSTVDPNPKDLKVIVHKPVPPSEWQAMQALSGDTQIVNHMLRQTWINERPEGESYVAGMLRMDELTERADQYVLGSNSNRCPFSALMRPQAQ